MSFISMPPHVTASLAAGPAAAAATVSGPDEGFSFHDLIDIVNPLQHIPVVSTIYRAITGEHIKTFPKIAGDTLFGGVTGFLSSVADTIFERITGKSVGDTVLSWVEDEISPSSTTAPTAVASAAPANGSNTPAATATMSFGDRLVAWVEDLVSPSQPATALASAAPATTAVATAAPTPLTPEPANVSPASLDTIVIPGQTALMMAMSRRNIDQELAARAASAYRSTLNVSDKAAASALH
jgi:membrane-associated protease RseP (regulator of RpoE activity)